MDKYLVLMGRPNAGKSSLIKKTFGLKVSIGKHPGTTKKPSKYSISRNLYLVDMPGYGRILKASEDKEERIKDQIIHFIDSNAENMDLSVHVLDISTFLETTKRLEKKGLRSLDVEMIHYLAERTGEFPLVAANKIDKAGDKLKKSLLGLKHLINEPCISSNRSCIFPVSAKTGEGIGDLKNEIHKRLVKKGYKTPFIFLKRR